MNINFFISMHLILVLLAMILGVFLADKNSIEIVRKNQDIIVAEKIKRLIEKDARNHNRFFSVVFKIQLNYYLVSDRNMFNSIVNAAIYKLTSLRDFTLLYELEKYIKKLLLVQFNKDLAEAYYCQLKVATFKKLIIANLIGSIMSIYLIRKAQQKAAITIYFIVYAIAIVIIYLPIDSIKQLKRKRQINISRELPKFVLKTNLLINAGLPLFEAVELVSHQKNDFFHSKMRNTVKKVGEGHSFAKSSKDFVYEYDNKELIQFFRIVTQAQIHGSQKFYQQLEDLRVKLQFNRLNNVKKNSELANAQLLLPLLMIFVGIMVIVIVPVFMSIL